LPIRYNKSYRLDANKRYSLSEPTAKIVKGLETGRCHHLLRQAERLPAAKDVLDRYSTPSSRIRVKFVDVEKNPQVARAAGVTKLGTSFVEIGTKKARSQERDRIGDPRAIIRDLKTMRAPCALSGGAASTSRRNLGLFEQAD